MTKTEFDAGYVLFMGTYAIAANRAPAYWRALSQLPGKVWLEVAQWHTDNAVNGQDTPTPAEIQGEVARQAANYEMARSVCNRCEHGLVMAWRVDSTGLTPRYYELTVDPERVASDTPWNATGYGVVMTSLACDCYKGQRLAKGPADGTRGYALASYSDKVGYPPPNADGAHPTLRNSILIAIAERLRDARGEA